MIRSLSVLLVLCIAVSGFSQPLQTGPWRGTLVRTDGLTIRFHFDLRSEGGKTVLYVINGSEKLRVDKIRSTRDSVFIEMPVFESGFRARRVAAGKWEGVWTKASSSRFVSMPFIADIQSSLTPDPIAAPVADISGRWDVSFTTGDEVSRPAIGEWQQKGYTLHGTILTPTGDYRYLNGVVDGDSLRLSTFDGSHAFLFVAKIDGDRKITGGTFYSGASARQPWIASKNENAVLPDVAGMRMKNPEEKLRFRFFDLNRKPVSLSDAKFANKVVVVQIMGSWCPNCMDETAFLSDYYQKNRSRGVEIVALAYEYTTDWQRARKSIEKFKDRFQVGYTILNTGVIVTDSLRTEKTLPQMTQIKSFPSTIFLDRQHRVAAVRAGFEGPGTGAHYEALKKDFTELVDGLLRK